MQNRSLAYRIHVMPIRLDPDYPLRMDDDSIQRDDPITHLHVHDCLEMGLCHEGQGVFVVGTKVLPFHAGDVVLINHTEVHLARSAPGTVSRWTWIYLDPVRLVGADLVNRFDDPARLGGPDFRNVMGVPAHSRLVDAVRQLVEEHRRRRQGWRDMARMLVAEVLIHAARTLPAQPAASTPLCRDFDRLAPALQEMSAHYDQQTPMGQFARRCGLSEAQFRRIFRRTLGVAPQAYRNGLRLRMALSMLRQTTHSILEISQMVGFESLSSFNRQFRATTGLCPRDVRAGRMPAPEHGKRRGGSRPARAGRTKQPRAR